MNSKLNLYYILSVAIATLFFSAQVIAEEDLLSGSNGSVKYITGGIGEEEQNKLEEVRHSYNMRVTSSDKTGAYIGDTHVNVINSAGNKIIDVDAGPLFYAFLPDGNYVIEATIEGKTKSKKVNVKIGKTTLVNFIW